MGLKAEVMAAMFLRLLNIRQSSGSRLRTTGNAPIALRLSGYCHVQVTRKRWLQPQLSRQPMPQRHSLDLRAQRRRMRMSLWQRILRRSPCCLQTMKHWAKSRYPVASLPVLPHNGTKGSKGTKTGLCNFLR